MAANPPDRRHDSDRRRSIDRADDLHQRIEQKRQEFDRRQKVRRVTDRVSAAEDRAKRRTGVMPEPSDQPSAEQGESGTPPAGK